MLDPTILSPGSIMPPYPWLLEKEIDTSITGSMIKAMIKLGVPYEEDYASRANQDLQEQALRITENLKAAEIETLPQKEIVALIAYLQRLGTDIKPKTAQK